MRGLEGKVAIVAGAAPGNIGAATAVRLAEEEAAVVVADLNESAAQSVVDEIRELDGRAVARSFDISDEASYKELIDFTVKEFGRLDGLFNVAADLSAATVARDSDVLSVPLDVWQHTIDVTLTGYMFGIRHALPIMIGRAVVRSSTRCRPVSGWVRKSMSPINPPRRDCMGSRAIPPRSAANMACDAIRLRRG